MGYVFISYSTRQQAYADAMHNILKEQGIDTWMAPGDIPVGEKYAAVINKAIKNSACLLLLLTDAAQSSKWVPKEVERAINYGKPIIPVQLEEVVLNDEFEFYISTDHLIALPKPDRASPALQKVIQAIAVHTGQRVVEPHDMWRPSGQQTGAVRLGAARQETAPRQRSVRRIVPIFYLIDTSGSMFGENIAIVNAAMHKAINTDLPKLLADRQDTEIRVGVLTYSSGCSWVTSPQELVRLQDMTWRDLSPSGLTDIGSAFRELNRQMSREGMLNFDCEVSTPVVFLFSDGAPTDDWLGGLTALRQNPYFKHAVKIAMSIGDMADEQFLAQFTGAEELVLSVQDSDTIGTLLNTFSMSAVTFRPTSDDLR